MDRQTRLKVTIGLLLLFFVEAILRAFLKEFPFAELIAAQGLVGGWYMDRKTKNNIEVQRNAQENIKQPD